VIRFVCVHGHFYQPPRENPWLDAIDSQPSAAPYHDWNARITAECYAPNTAARILDEQGRIQHIINNYAWMSFNVGPTLMRWLAQAEPVAYAGILAADKEGQARFGGHGPAIGQAYGHIIMPLATPRDRRTQVAWGVADFHHHFGRNPEGMWLPEAAVCTDSLEALAEYGVRYTVLAPHQAARFRALGTDEWQDVAGTGIDTTVPYRVNLPSGRQIAIFFYNGSVSQSIAFQGLLNSGESLAQALLGNVSADTTTPRLAHVATDGETYGHHHRHGEMALAYALHHIHDTGLARITVYGEFLALCPPQHEVQIVEQSSWSCSHGVERWRSDCGCHTGGALGWNQAWRGPLRHALEWARTEVDAQWEKTAARVFANPWQARDAYIEIINDPSDATVKRFLTKNARNNQRWPALALLELQRQLMQSFTSCAWFFNDPSGIETIQVLRYAARMMQLAKQTLQLDLEEGFHEQLEQVVSNTGVTVAELYTQQVQPLTITLADICAHDALTALFIDTPPADVVYLHHVMRQKQQRWTLDQVQVVIGVSDVTALLTGEQSQFVYGVVLMGEQVLAGGVRPEPERYQRLQKSISDAIKNHDQDALLQAMHSELGRFDYSLRSIFRDEQRTILTSMLRGVVDSVAQQYHQMYAEHANLMRFLQRMTVPLPPELQMPAAMAVHADIRAALRQTPVDTAQLQSVLQVATQSGVVLDKALLAYEYTQTLHHLAAQLVETPCHADLLQTMIDVADIAQGIDVDMWMVQNNYNVVWQRDYALMCKSAAQGNSESTTWVAEFRRLGSQLNMAIVATE
jgi:alpha-amylase/alpha-mannosidase (GH57 family)